MPQLGRHAWTAVGVTVLFIALTCWWLARNRAMPYGDAGFHITTALEFHDALASGRWTEPFTWNLDVYPPLTPLVGALGFFFGRTPSAPVVVENLVYVPLLALACYRIARRAYGPLAGCLAVMFALGAPLIAEQFHVFMLDAPLTALVAGTVWLVLESERFSRVPVAGTAGAVAGFGLLSKQMFPLYVTGFVLLVLVGNGGWRNVRGLCVFMAAALLVAMPWYAAHVGEIHQVVADARSELNIPPAAKPPILSTMNVLWYFWGLANGVLFAPLLTFAVIGVIMAAVALVRRRTAPSPTVELLGGLLLAFAAITMTPHKDVRYAMPLLVFLAVLGTAWIASARRALRIVGIAALTLAIAASTVGATFGVGSSYPGMLPGNWEAPEGQGVMPLNRFIVYANHDYMVSGPRRAGDLLSLFDELRRGGVRYVRIFGSQAPREDTDFNLNGLRLFARLAHLTFPTETDSLSQLGQRVATLIHADSYGSAPPCVRLPRDGGVWIRLGDPSTGEARDYCPRFARPFYGP